MQKFLRLFVMLALLFVPCVTMGQNARVSEYDGSAATATYSTIVGTSGATAWAAADQTAGYVDIAMPFAMYFGETQVTAGSMLRVYGNGSATFESVTGLEGSRLAPLYYASGYNTTANSIHYKSSAQQLTVEWRKVTANGANSYSFQLKLYSNGDIEFCYGPMTTGGTLSVFTGLMSASTDVFRATGESSASDWSTLARATTSGTRMLSSNYYPAEGTVYTFTQPACVKPTGITATATAWNTVNVEWTVSSTGNSYQVKYSTDPDFDPSTEGQTVTSTSLTANVTGLTGSTTYYFYVRKMCGSTPSGWSSMATATTLPGCYSANMPSVTPDGVVTWTSPNELVTSYDVKYGPVNFDPENEGTAINNIAGLTTTLPVASMASASTYEIYLRAHCSASGLTTDWVGPVSYNTPCAAVTISSTNTINEGFEGTACPPVCWTGIAPSSANPLAFATDNYYSGAQSFLFSSYSSADDYNQYLISPELNSTTQMQVAFKYARYGSGDNIRLGYSTTTNDTTAFTWMDWMTGGVSSWDSYTAMVPANTKYIAIHYYGNYSYYVWVDDMAITPPPTCPNPSALAIDDVTGNNVTLSWTENGTATAWQIAYGLFTTDDDYVIVDATTNPFTVSGLGLGEWFFYVRSNCAANDQSEWIGGVSQNFGYCTPAPTSVDGSGISNVTFGNTLVVNDNTATGTNRYQNHTDMIGDLFAGAESELSITYRTGFTYGTKIWIDFNDDFDFEDDGELVYTGLSASSNPTTLVATFTIPVNAPLGDHRMRIGGTDNDNGPDACYSSSYGVLRDYTVRVVAAPSCFKPNSLAVSGVTSTEATLTWVEAGLSTQWEVKLGAQGFNPDEEGTSYIVNGTPTLALDYLFMVTDYDAYVRAICDPEGPTEWSNVCEFRTFCPNGGSATLGTGTTNTSGVIVNSSWGNTYCQQIFTAAELAAAGLQAGDIAGMTFTWNGNGSYQKDFSIYLGNTTQENFSSTTAWVPIASQTLVYGPTLRPTTGTAGEQEYTFTTPFTWDGTSNIVVSTFINQHGGSQTGSGFNSYSTNSGMTNMAMWKYRDSQAFTESEVDGLTASSRSGYRASIKFIRPCDTGSCNAPTTVIALSETEYAATLTFTDVNGEANPTYGIVYGPQGFDPTTAGTTVSPINANNYTISNLVARTSYDVYVYAICSGTNGRMVKYNFVTPFIPNCKTPIIDGEYGASNITYNTATLTWRQPGDAPLFWTVRYADADFDPATAAAADYTELTIQGTAGATAQLTGLVAGTTYYIYIKATCATAPDLDESPWLQMSNANPAYTFTTPACVEPTNVAANDVTNSTAMISWTEAGNATAWTVKYGPAGFDPDNEGIAVAATADSIELTGLDAYINYEVYVKANCTATDESDWSAAATFRTVCPDGGSAIIGDGTSTTTGVPVANYGSTYCQQIFTADELREAGVANSIAGLGFNWQAIDASFDKYFTIWLANTDKSSFASTSDFVPYSELTKVYGPVFIEHGTGAGEQEYVFNNAFQWDGTSNIVVVTLMNAGSTDNNASRRAYTHNTGVSNISMYQRKDNSQYTEEQLATITGSSRSTYRANITFIAPCNTSVTCFAPATVTTTITPANVVTVNWAPRTDLRPVVNNYELKYGLEGFDPETQGVLVPALNNVNTYIINADLAANTNYDVYVRTVCDADNDDYSNWTKASFTTYPTCWVPVDLTVTGTTQTTATLSWANNELAPTAATRWEVSYGPAGFGDPEYRGTKVETTNNTAFEVTGLNHTTKYDFYVRAICSATDKSEWSAVATGTTQCGVWQYADMPLVENFDGVTGTTSSAVASHVLPNCWNYLNGGTSYPGYPIAYNGASYSHSGSNHMRFYEYNTTAYADQYAILPEFGFDLDTVVVGFYARESSTTATYVGNIEVGVMTDPEDASTFVAVGNVLPTTTSYQYFEVSFAEYEGTGRYIALKAPKTESGYNIVYVDDLTVKLREKVNSLSDNGQNIVACNEFIMPDTTNGETYHGGLNATYVVRPAQAGHVARIQGDYDLENGYDFLNVYRGAVNANNLVGRYTGTGSIDYMTNSELWQDSGYVTLVFTSDADNALNNAGFKFLVTCEQPNANPTPIEDVVEANGTYTWTAGNGETFTQHSTMDAAPDQIQDITFWLTNVAGYDSVAHHLTLTLHPTYELTYSHVMCDRDTFDFYGQTYTTTGNYTVTLQSIYGADSVGKLALQVNPAPLAMIYHNNQEVETVENYCDNFDMLLEGRSNVTATYKWDDESTDALRTVNPHESSTYSVVATNATTGCTSLPATVTVTTTPVPALTISGDAEICFGQSATLTVSDANALDANYRWSTNATGTTITVNPTETTTYTVTATTTNASACAVTAEFTVTVNPLPVIATPTASVSELCLNESVTLNAQVVEGYSYEWSTGATTAEATTVPAATGAYTVTVTDLNGCVNEFTTAAITVHPSYELNEERSACIGMLPYTWGAMTLTEAGNFDQHFTIAHGCDSLVHLTFVVEDTAVNNAIRELCEGVNFTFGEGIYEQTYTATASTVLTYVDTTSGECPARYNLNLTVNTHNPATVENTVCDTYTWPLTNETYTVSGEYQTMLQTTKGCDSLVTLNLTVNYQNTGIEEVPTVCDSYTWELNGQTYTEPTSEPTFTLQNQWGCDSVVTLNLAEVKHSTTGVDNIIYCASTEYTWINGRTYRLSETSGNVSFTLPTPNAQGCDTTSILNLTMNYVLDSLNWKDSTVCDEFVIDTVACDNSVATAYIRESGDYKLRIHNATTGEDQILRLHLTVLPSTYHTTIATECLPYTWTITGADDQPFEIATITADKVNGAAVYNMSVDMAEAGYVSSTCSNIEVLRLTPKYPTTEVTDYEVICQNGTWTADNGTVYRGSDYEAGTYTLTWDNSELNEAGCQLTKQVELTVNPTYNETLALTLCESEFENGAYVLASTADTETVVLTIPEGGLNEEAYNNSIVANWHTATGCDSVVTITYTVNPIIREEVYAESCYKYTWELTGETFDFEDGAEQTAENIAVSDSGCLLITTLHLTLNDTIRGYVDTVVCTSYEYEGVTYRTDKTFKVENGPVEGGCDSATYIRFHVQQTELVPQYVVSNRPYTWRNGQTFSQSVDNIYYDEPGEGDCGNVYVLHLTMVDPITFCDDAFPYATGIDSITISESDVVMDTASFCLDNPYQYSIGRASGEVLWGIKFSANRPTDYYNVYGAQLYFVNGYPGTYTLKVYDGDDDSPVTLLGTKTITFSAEEATGWKYFQLDEPLTIDNQNLWVTFDAGSVTYPAAVVNYFDASDQNGAWVSGDGGITWTSLNENNSELFNSFMIKTVYSANMWRNNDPQGNDTILYYTVNPTYNTTVEMTVCDSYTWDSTTYTESGLWTKSYTSAEGCDSVYNVNLTVNVSTDSVLTDVACDSYSWAGKEFTVSGDYVIDTNAAGEPLKNVAGCDSTATLHLTINTNEGVEESLTACDSLAWVDGNVYYVSGDYTHTFTDANGCTGDSLLHLTINTTVVANFDSIVNAASTIYLGVLYEAPKDTVINDTVIGGAANGCDSITMMHLQVNMGNIIVEDTVSCGDFTWRDGNTYTWIPMSERTNPAFNYKNLTTNQPVEDYPVFETYNENGIVINTYVLHLTMAEASTEYKTVTVLLSNDTYTDATNGHVFDFAAEKLAGQNTTKLDTIRFADSTGFTGYFCDSIVYYTFNLIYNYVDDEPLTYCYEQDSYTTQNGDVIALAVGENTLTDTTAAGTADEMVHNMVIVRSAAITGTETLVACDSITWEGTLYTANVVDEQVTLTAANGCDSVVTLNITITPTIHNVVDTNVCDNFYWADKDSTYEVSTTDTWSRANTTNAQCTDVDTLKLVVRHMTTSIDSLVACDSLVWIDGITYYASNSTATHTLTNAAGCDSVVTLNLTVNHSFTGAGRDIDTLGASITLTDKNGTYLFLAPYDNDTTLTLQTVAGCDSVVNFHLTVSQFQIIAENPIECGMYIWPRNNHMYQWISDEVKAANAINIPGASPMLPLYKDVTADVFVYNNPLDTVNDIVYLLNLNLNEAQFVDSTIARFPQSVGTLTLHGTDFDFTGVTSAENPVVDTVVYVTLPNDNLCGTVMMYNVHVVYNYTTDAETVCYTDTYEWEDNTTSPVTVGSGNVITKTLFADDWSQLQVVTRTITVRAANNTYGFNAEACDSYTWNNETYTTSGEYQQHFTDQYGCDSVATLTLTVKYNSNQVEPVVTCDSTLWHGTWYFESGDYTYEYTADNGCPSVDTLRLTINVNTTGTNTPVVACDEYTWEVNNRLYTTSGTYTARITDANGCFDTDTLTLTINSSTHYDSVLWVTDGSYRYQAQDGTYTMIMAGNSGSFTEHYTNAAQCDSALNITIHVGEGYFAVDDVTNCNNYTWRNGNTYFWISAEEREANGNALYKDTNNVYVMSNPIFRVQNEGDYDSIYMLRLNLTQNYTEDVTINFPITLDSLVYGDSTFHFGVSNDEGREFVNTTVEREVHFHSDYYCDSIHYLTINLQNNYSEIAADAADICVTQTSYTWRGHEINTTTSDFDHAHIYYVYDTVGTAEAPVVEYITVTQHPVVYATERRTACDSYTWNGITFTESTSNATFDTVDRFGCDSTVTLMLTIHYNTSTEYTVNACETYTWADADGGNGMTYTESGVYTRDYLTTDGCPSTNTLNLTVNYNTSTKLVVDVCDSYTWDLNGQTYTESDSVTFDYLTAENCPSTDTLVVTIRNNSNYGTTVVACDSFTWTVADGGNGETYTESGVYTIDYEAANGCPSTDTLNLTVNHNNGHTDVVIACDSTLWNGTWYYEDNNTATYAYTDANGCASIDTLSLTVNAASHNSETVVACQTYEWHGTTYTNPSSVGDMFYGTYTYTYLNDASCLSVDTLHLTLGGGRTFGTQTVTNCGPYTWIVNNEEVATLDESMETSTSFVNPRTGCDSVVFLTLTIFEAPVFDTAAVICDSELPYLWKGETLTEAGQATVTYPFSENCDSTVRLTLTVNASVETNLTDQVCLGSDYTGYNFNIAATELPAAGEYTFTDHLTTVNGCDSTVNLTLTVGDVLTNTLAEVVACDSYSWTAGDGETYELTATGNYASEVYANEMGCTTVDVLPLTINASNTGVDVQVACDNFTWIDGNVYTESNNTATYTLTNAAGCDSVVTLNLTINNAVLNNIEMTVCDSYEWNGETLTTTGFYTYNYTTPEGCNGIDNLLLTVNNSTTGNEVATACDSYTWNGETYTESGEYTFNTTNAAGCDSTATLTLTINTSNTGVDVQTACDSYTWIDGNVYTVSNNTATYTLTNVNGCDSVVTLNLTINNSVANAISDVACNSYVWEGSYYTESGEYTKTFEAANGCDSIVTLTLTINQPVAETISETACGSYTWNGITYNASGNYTQTDVAANGCDSVTTLVLTINQPVTGAFTDAACESYTWNGETYTESGAYTQTFTAANGCDSVVTLTLTINAPANTTEDVTACESYTWHGQVYTTNGAYTYNFTDNNGCAAVATLNLTINQPANTTETVTACNSYSWNNQTYTSSGVYTSTFVDANGCNATATLSLTINNPVNATFTVTECESYTWHGQVYTVSGNYTYTTTAANGCDSIETLVLTINQPTTATFYAEACGSYTWNGTTYTQPGAYPYTTTGSNGCDSTVTLLLNLVQPVQTIINQTACDSYTWNGTTYTTSGSYSVTFTAANNCDSVVTLNLTVNNSVSNSLTATACESYTWNGQTYATSGSYTQVFTAHNGCDSTVTLALTINTPTTATVTETACSSFDWNGETYTTSGSYTYTTTGANGCDSVTTLLLTINLPVYTNLEANAEGSYSWNGETYTESGVYTYTTTAANGCDSVVTLTLTITPVYTVTLVSQNEAWGSVSESGTMAENGYFTATATANEGYEFVAWLNGNDTVSTSSTYIFQVTEDITLTAVFAEVQGISAVDMNNVVIYSTDSRIFVNGAEGYDVYVYDVNGRVINRQMKAADAIEFRMTTTGVYLVKVGNAPAKRVVVVR